MLSGKFTVEETQKRIYIRVLKEYLTRVFAQKPTSPGIYNHVGKLIDSVEANTLFHEDSDFSAYYASYAEGSEERVMADGKKKYQAFLKTLD